LVSTVCVFLGRWGADVGQSLTEEIAKAMDESLFIPILITAN
jgi:hypothetical protein